MRRGLVLACLWALGVTASVAVAFAAVGRVASHVAPPGVARLSAGAVDRALARPDTSTTSVPRKSSTTTRSTPTTRPHGSTTTTSSKPTTGPTVSAPPSTAQPPPTSAPPRTTPTTPPPTTTTTVPHNTVTTSQGGTVWTKCVGPEQIAYVAAVPKAGYERTHDVENSRGIVQWFESDTHVSRITAECSDGVVHAEVEEETVGDAVSYDSST